MNKRTIALGLLCSASLIALTGTLQAQEDHLIENQRYVVGIADFAWGDTYVGKYTSDNGLIVQEYITGSETNEINLTVDSLQIGSATNSGNYVDIYKGGQLDINGNLSILNTNIGEGLTIYDQGTLFMKSDFDADMAGFFYESGARLKVGGTVTNLDQVEGGLNFTLTGENATWAFGTNILTIGASTDSNSVTLASQATLDIDNIALGDAGTTSNKLVVTDQAKMTVRESINIFGTGNTVEITSNGVLAVYFDFSPITNLDISEGGILEAHNNLNYSGGITNGGGIIMTGTNANWSTLSGSTLNLAQSTNDTQSVLTITDGATVRVGDFNISNFEDAPNDNAIIVVDGGRFIVESGGNIGDEGATLLITEGGRLILESDFNIFGVVDWYNGGIIEAYGLAPIVAGVNINDEYVEVGGAFLNNGKILKVIGPAGLMDASGYNFHLGDVSANNALILTNGAQGIADSISIGDFKEATDRGEGGNNNSILITGTNSALYSTTYAAIGGTIDSGNWYEGGISNSITVENGGLFQVGTMLHNRNTTGTSGLNIKPGGLVEADNYYQAAGAYLVIYTDAAGTNAGLLRVTDTAEFENGAQVGFDAVAALAIGTTYTNLIVEAGTLIVDGVTNAATGDLDALENIGGSLVNYDLWETNQNIYATFTRRSIADGGEITDSLLTQIGDEIDRLAGSGNAAASNQVAILSGLSSAQVNQQMSQMYLYQLPSYMHNQGVFGGIDQVRARGSSFHGAAPTKALPQPTGVRGPGPHAADQGLQGWAKVYGSYGNRDEGKIYNDGYDLQAYGTVIGLDQAFNEWLFGIGGGYAGSTLDGDNGDESEATTGYGMIYASYGTKEWFGDFVASYGTSDIDNDSGTAFAVTSSTEASQTAFYIGGGKEFKDPDGSDALLRPLLALQISQYDQDGYTEKSSNAVGKKVDGYDRWSYQSIFGVEMIIPAAGTKIDLETQLRAYWLHEFNDDEEKVGYTLVGSTQPGQFVLQSPAQDIGQLGIGCVAKWDNGVQLRADLDGQVSDDFFSTTLSGALIYEF